MSDQLHRVMVIAHGHPDFHLGGGELAAYGMYRAYSELPGVEKSVFVGRHASGKSADGQITSRRPNEYLWDSGISDWFMMRSSDPRGVDGAFAELVRNLKPTVVHLHHYLHMGLEVVPILRQVDPSIRILLTLHEYVAICFNDGQMIKTGANRLCSRETPEDCARCFPDRAPAEFWLRKHRYRSIFGMIDGFVAPSEFLRQRYIDWGLAPNKIITLENGQPKRNALPPRPIAHGEKRNRFAYFGQVTPFKGVDLLLQALTLIPRANRRDLVVEIHATNLENQPQALRDRIGSIAAPLIKDGILQWIGPYEPFQQSSRLQRADWVVVPSIWWENSPMVIQEAFSHGRPVIASDIGGMAEKVTHGVDGLHVQAGNARAWAETLIRAATDDDALWQTLREGIKTPPTPIAIAQAHLDWLERV